MKGAGVLIPTPGSPLPRSSGEHENKSTLCVETDPE